MTLSGYYSGIRVEAVISTRETFHLITLYQGRDSNTGTENCSNSRWFMSSSTKHTGMLAGATICTLIETMARESKPRPVGQWFQIVHGQGGGGNVCNKFTSFSTSPHPPNPLQGQEPIHLARQIMLCDTRNKQTNNKVKTFQLADKSIAGGAHESCLWGWQTWGSMGRFINLV
jgi:hypothetical protein